MRFRPLVFSVAIFVLLCPRSGPAAPFGPSPPAVHPGPPRIATDPDRWLPWRVFTWRDGVKPVNPPLAQDARGYIWADGPVRYNGRTWQRIEIPGEPSPLRIWSLLAVSDGSLWFGRVEGGLLILRNGVWERRAPGPGLPEGMVNAMVEEDHTVWVGTASGLARCREGGCSEESSLRGTSVHCLAATRTEDGRPALWIGTNSGLLRLDGVDGPSPTLSPPFRDRTALPDLSVRSLAETVSPEGERSLWVGTDGGVARLLNGVWTRYDSRSGFPPGPIVRLLPSRSAAGRPVVWAGSFLAGVLRFEEDGRWSLHDSRSGLPANNVYNLLTTPAGAGEEPTLWVTTPGGVARLERERWIPLDTRSGLPSENVVGLGETTFPDGLRTYWIGTVSGLVRRTPRGWEGFTPVPHETPAVFAATEAREEDGSPAFWMGTANGLLHFSHGRWTSFDKRNAPLPHPWVWSLLAVPSGRGTALWAGGPRGLVRYEAGRWTVFDATSGVPGNPVSSLLQSRLPGGGSVLWAGTNDGLGRFASGRWEKATVPCLPSPLILDLESQPSPDGTWLWIGTQGGLARMRLDPEGRLQGPCQALTGKTKPALAPPSVQQIRADAYGRVYLFTDWGAHRLTLPPGGDLAAARLESYDTEDGLPAMEFNRTSFVDHLGRVWAGTIGGAAVFDPPPPLPAGGTRRAPPLRLERVLVAGRERPLPAGAALRHDEASLEFRYALLSYRRENATRYRTQLAGLENRPSAWTPEARVVYNRLPQGEYTFRVWGRDGDGVISGPLEVRFRVRPPPWLTPWALALYALALMGLGYGANLLRSKALARRAAALEAQVAERTRELAEANRKLELASLTDPLTGLSNRRFLNLDLESGPRQTSLIFYFLDVDHFKQLNDRLGHDAGDRVLVEIAARLKQTARDTDAVVRWGGEEFLIVSRGTDRRTGEALADRLLEAVGGAPFGTGPETVRMTCSVGWAPWPWRPEAPEAVHREQVMSLADKALYLAKREGRDRAVGVLPGPDGSLFPIGALESHEGTLVELVRSAGSESPMVGSRKDPPPSWNP